MGPLFPFFERVLQAVMDNDAQALEVALDAGPPAGDGSCSEALRNPRAIAMHGISPLILAVWKRNPVLVQRLLEIDPQQALDVSGDGHTPLMVALRHPETGVVDLLLPVSDLTVADPVCQETVLDQMATHARPAIVARCLACLAQAPRNRDGRTPLMVAAANGPSGTVALLLPVSDPDARDPQGRTAMMLATVHGKQDNLRALLPWSDLGARDHEGHSAVDLLSLMAAEDERRLHLGHWGCLDLLALFEPRHAGLIGLTRRAARRHLPRWHDPVQADQERRTIVLERERRVLQATLDDHPVMDGLARSRVRL